MSPSPNTVSSWSPASTSVPLMARDAANPGWIILKLPRHNKIADQEERGDGFVKASFPPGHQPHRAGPRPSDPAGPRPSLRSDQRGKAEGATHLFVWAPSADSRTSPFVIGRWGCGLDRRSSQNEIVVARMPRGRLIDPGEVAVYHYRHHEQRYSPRDPKLARQRGTMERRGGGTRLVEFVSRTQAGRRQGSRTGA